MNNLSTTLTETIKDENFQEIATELGEIGIDSILSDGVQKDVPFLATLYGIGKLAMSIQDKLFIKKILTFLFELQSTNTDSRKKQIEKIDNDTKYQTKVGEKLLYIIDKCEDNEKASFIGKLFQYFIEEKIDYDSFLRTSKCIELTFLPDLKDFVRHKWDNMEIEEAGEFIGSGLMTAIFTPAEQTWDSDNDGSLKLRVSSAGKLIQDLLAGHV